MAKDDLIASVSHEIRTPLTEILGITSELAAESADFSEPERKELLGAAADEAQVMSDIVEDLLTSARARAGTLTVMIEPFDPSVAALSVTRSAAFRDTPIELRIERGVMATGDRLRTRQIIRNLLSNARRYGGPGIRINVTTSDVGYPLLEVSDDGFGIDEGVAARLFEPYVSSGQPQTMPGSIGIGLAVSRTLAERMSASLTNERLAGRTVFTLSLPSVPVLGTQPRTTTMV
jgi:signal transduction histidine kinase